MLNKFAGHGMHLCAMSVWMAFIMSQCRSKEEMSLPPVFFQDEQDDWQSSDDEEPASGCGQQLGQSSAAEIQGKLKQLSAVCRIAGTQG